MDKEKVKQSLKANVKRNLITGLFVIIPLGITYLILKIVFKWLDGILSPIIVFIFGDKIPGLGFISTVLLIYLTGLFTANLIGKKTVAYLETLLAKVPLVRDIYSGSKQLVETVSLKNKNYFQRVVLLEYPRKGLRVIGFVTGETIDKRTGEKLIQVFIPTTPNPTTGMLVIGTENEVTDTDMSIETGIKIVISGGIIFPKEFESRERRKLET